MRKGVPGKLWVRSSDRSQLRRRTGTGIYSVGVVIVDYFMPEMSGHEVAIETKRLRPQAPIIMRSGAGDVPEQALKSVDAFVAKDRLASELLPAIAQLQGC